MSIIKIAGVALIALCASLVVKQLKPEYGIYIPIIAATVIFIYALSALGGIITSLSDALNSYGVGQEYIKVLFKSIGIAYITQFAVDCCKDAGESAIAGKVELCGKVMVLSCALPVMFSVLDMIDEVMKLI